MHARLLSVVVVGTLTAALHPAAATCPGSRAFDTGSSQVYTPGTCDNGPPCSSDIGSSVTSSLAGEFWRIGYGNPSLGAGADNGGFPALPNGWVLLGGESPAVVAGDWNADLRIDGCIESPPTTPFCMALALSDQAAGLGYFALLSAPNDLALNYDFAQSGGGPIVLGEIPRPVIIGDQPGAPGHRTLVVRNGTVPEGGLYLDGASCDDDLIAGYRVYQQRRFAPGQAPIDRKRGDWQIAPGGAGPGGQPIPLGTSTQIDVETCGVTYLALTLVFDSGFETGHVSRNVTINFNQFCSDYDCDGWFGFCEVPGFPVDCNDGDPSAHPDATEVCNGIDDNCNGQVDENASGVDADVDGVPDACDNCAPGFNPPQTDVDHDGEGDICDADDGLIYIFGTDDKTRIEWQLEDGPSHFNVYAGDLGVLRATGVYTQEPGSNSVAARHCGLVDNSVEELGVPPVGAVQFSLVTGVTGGVEGGLGTDHAGAQRLNSNPCP